MKTLIKKQLSKVLVLGAALTVIFGSPVFGQSPDRGKPTALKEPIIPDLYLDEEYRKEIDRHIKIMGFPLPPDWMRNVPMTPQKYKDVLRQLF